MARQKNPTALFDAIYSAKKPPKPSPSAAIPTPKWWGKNKTLPKPPVPESTENAGRQRSWLSAAKKSGVAAVPATTTASVETAAEQPLAEYAAPVGDGSGGS